MLRRAADLLARAGGPEEKVIDLLQQVLRLEANDEDARARLEALYVKANRFRDVVRLNEQALAADPPPSDATRRKLLEQIISLYAEKLHEPERAMPHVEQLLALDPRHEEARKVAQKLVVIKGLAGRAAAAMATASEVYGTPPEIARYLTIELENTRGPKRANTLMRLGKLKADRMGDDKGAFEAFEQALAIDPSDDELRARYTSLADKQRRWADAAKALGRVLATVKDPGVKAKASAQLGEMMLRGGDAKRAKTTLAGVLALADAPPEAILAAAHVLREILDNEGDARALCDVLEKIANLEPDLGKRQAVDDRLAELATALGDTPKAIAAYERLLATPSRGRALEALAPLYEASGDPQKYALLMEERAKDTADPDQARGLMVRAAEVRTKETKDAAAAIASCRAVIERFGPARDVLGPEAVAGARASARSGCGARGRDREGGHPLPNRHAAAAAAQGHRRRDRGVRAGAHRRSYRQDRATDAREARRARRQPACRSPGPRARVQARERHRAAAQDPRASWLARYRRGRAPCSPAGSIGPGCGRVGDDSSGRSRGSRARRGRRRVAAARRVARAPRARGRARDRAEAAGSHPPQGDRGP
jgi:tetratricopeptide (TPR) repeat protein